LTEVLPVEFLALGGKTISSSTHSLLVTLLLSSSSSCICHGVGSLVDPFRSHVSRSLFLRSNDDEYYSLSSSTVILTFSWYTLFSQTRKWRPSHSGITVSPGMEDMSSLNMPVQRLKVAILPLDLSCSGPVTN
jgi:hypothetical protein